MLVFALGVAQSSHRKIAATTAATSMRFPCRNDHETLSCCTSLPTLGIRKIRVSVKYLSAILGPETGAQFYGRLEFLISFCRTTSMSIKFLVLGGGILGFGGGGECRFYFYGRGDFSDRIQVLRIIFIQPG